MPGTSVTYSASSDPITDVNTSVIFLNEVNDLTDQTYLAIRCSDRDAPELWATLNTKNALLTEMDAEARNMPAVTMRTGTDSPMVLRNSDVISVLDGNDNFKETTIGFRSTGLRTIVNGLNAGKRLVIRVNRPSGGQALTYTFNAQGFSQAWNAVNACTSSTSYRTPSTSAPTASGATGLVAPKFTRWYFTTCQDASTGTQRTGLVAGRAHLCDLVIETIPNGARPVSAVFSYELEYREGGRSGKLILDTADRWPSSGGPVTRFRQNGSQLIFTLPLNVRARPDRVYTSINVTGTVFFDNGSNKKVYEPLPVKPAY
ncbi:hypothetical protein [Deinococcus xinjiangensis]|uniref:hypothetical protein n=1 Tax=Deinococcus xinjiangensis TaxID=457454 RepID=UPI00336553ED